MGRDMPAQPRLSRMGHRRLPWPFRLAWPLTRPLGSSCPTARCARQTRRGCAGNAGTRAILRPDAS